MRKSLFMFLIKYTNVYFEVHYSAITITNQKFETRKYIMITLTMILTYAQS